jgi:energy-coupling factor transporter ATP-binding protein EcfA2
MKVERLSIQNFKRFSSLDVSFKNEELDEVSNRFLILGDNGSGKTTLLQAVALPLALATRQIRSVQEFDWIGFLPERYYQWGRPRLELDVIFSTEEIQATREVAQRWFDAQSAEYKTRNPFIEPGDSTRVRLILDGDSCRAPSPEEFYQFRGRYYAQNVLRTDPSARRYFVQLPGVFWFDQFRNLASSAPSRDGQNGDHTGEGRVAYEFGVARLRRYLSGWMLAQRAGVKQRYDYLSELEHLYQTIFPERSFAGVEQMPGHDAPTAEDFFFLLSDGQHTYDVTEMSAGEQAVFPILYEFVRSHIAHSVVLIDEIDLNLHPPIAQSLTSQLPQIGPTCQFLLTTHSNAVTDIIGPHDTYRLSGGVLCL